MIKKRLLVLLLAAVMAVSMMACGGGANKDAGADTSKQTDTAGDDNSKEKETEAPPEKVTLQVWIFGTTGYDELSQKYTEANPHVTLEFNSIASGDHHDRLFTALSAGTGAPHVTQIDVDYMPRFRETQNVFYNLYDFGANEIKDLYLEWKWNLGLGVDDSFLIALPTDIGPTAAYYRMDVFEEAGLPSDPDSVGKLISTWEKFKETARTIKQKTGKPMSDSVELVFNALRDQAQEQYFNEKDELIIENSPYIKQAYDFTVSMIKEGLLGTYSLWETEWNAGMSSGSYATLLAPAWMAGVIMGNAPDATKWCITSMPEGAGNWGGSFMAIPKQCSEAEAKEAYNFIKWLCAPEQQVESFKMAGLFPCAIASLDDATLASTPVGDGYFNGATAGVFAEAAKQIKDVYKGKHYPVANAEIVKALYTVALEGADPEAEWAKAVEAIKNAIRE
ncbi:MAG TPA: extracellular solute-binding protein [Clostridiaceae bacterium]|nr:extracellular solute-binding protein [Clostridiaceae bacterium]